MENRVRASKWMTLSGMTGSKSASGTCCKGHPGGGRRGRSGVACDMQSTQGQGRTLKLLMKMFRRKLYVCLCICISSTSPSIVSSTACAGSL